MIKKYKDIIEINKNKFCNYYENDCFKCTYRLTDKYRLWCRVKGEYVYEYKIKIK